MDILANGTLIAPRTRERSLVWMSICRVRGPREAMTDIPDQTNVFIEASRAIIGKSHAHTSMSRGSCSTF